MNFFTNNKKYIKAVIINKNHLNTTTLIINYVINLKKIIRNIVKIAKHKSHTYYKKNKEKIVYRQQQIE